MSVTSLTIETAPRGVPELSVKTGYELLRFASSIGMLPTPESDAAFQRLPRSERAEQIAAALKAYDAKHGGTPTTAQPATPMQTPAPVAPAVATPEPAAQPTPVEPPAPAQPSAPATVTGRKPRNSGAAAPTPTQPQPSIDPGIGMIAGLRDDVQTIKANVDGIGKSVFELSRQGEQQAVLTQKMDAIIWMLGQLAESVIGGGGLVESQQFIDDAFKAGKH